VADAFLVLEVYFIYYNVYYKQKKNLQV
jgi:hypothetical protein